MEKEKDSEQEKKDIIGIWTIAIIVGHIIGYYNGGMGPDELFACIFGYIAVWGVLRTTI